MTVNLTTFIKDLSFETLQAYADITGAVFDPPLTESPSHAAFQRRVHQVFPSLSPEIQARWLRDFDDVNELQRGAAGVRTLNVAVRGWPDGAQAFSALRSGRDRALWLLVADKDRYRNARSIRFFERHIDDENVWTAFEIAEGIRVPEDLDSKVREVFCPALNALLTDFGEGGDRVIDALVWRRADPDEEDLRERGGYQITIRRGELRDLQEQVVDGSIEDLEVQLTKSFGIIYEPARGLIDVITKDGGPELREAIACEFCELVLGVDVVERPPRLRLLRLDTLAQRQEFVWQDLNVDDVKLVWMRVTWPGRNAPILDVRPRYKSDDLWNVASRSLRRANKDGLQGAEVLQARLQVTFGARPGEPKHQRSLRLDKSGRSNLRELAGEDRVIADALIDQLGLRVRTVRGIESEVGVLASMFDSDLAAANRKETRGRLGELVDHPGVQACLKPACRLQHVVCPTCEEPHDVHRSPEGFDAEAAIYCPEGGWSAIAADDLEAWTFDRAAFLGALGRALGLRARDCQKLAPDILWSLGEVDREEQTWTAFVGRSLMSVDAQNEVKSRFLMRPRKASAILFAADPPILLTASETHLSFARFEDVFNLTPSGELYVDWEATKRALRGKPPKAGKPGPKSREAEVWAAFDRLSAKQRGMKVGSPLAKLVESRMKGGLTEDRIYRILKKGRDGSG